jgi:hypothetical protein
MPDWTQEIQAVIKNLDGDPSKEAEIIEEISRHLNDRELRSCGKTCDMR